MNPLSGVIGEAWQMYKAHAKHLLAIAFVIYLVAAIISAVLGLLGTIGIYLALLVSIIALFLLQATLVKAVQDVRDGRADLSISETVNQAMPYIGAVAGASILAGVAIFIGFILIIVPGLILITIWAVIVPVIVIERSGALASFGRSRELVRGRAWHVFGTLVLVWIILFVADIILGLIFSFVPTAVRGGLASVISGTLVAPFIALVVTLIYYRLSSTMAPAGGAPYGGYQQPQDGGYGGYQQPQGGGWQQPPQQGGGWQQPPQQGGGYGGDQPTQAGGWQQPPQGGGNYGGYQQPPQGDGYQQPPQGGGYQQPPRGGGYQGDQPTRLGGYQQPPQGGGDYGGYQQPPQGGGYQGDQPTRQVPRYTGPQDDDGYGKR
jgi:hypothetical protein